MSLAVGSDSPPLVGRYLIQRMLGQGGMGAVYLARDLKYDRLVAVKFLSDQPARAVGAERFLREIRTTARLNHPHILPVHDSGEVDGQLFYVMPHVEGSSLRDRLDRTSRLPLPEALRIACEAAGALAYAHAHGIIHRDIKPDNVLLDPGGHVYLADFGLAHALSAVDSSRLTSSGLVVGSPYYMSPEQAVGEEDVDGRTDIYSLGCVLYEMLAGEPPFAGPTANATMRRHLADPPPSLRSRRADVPPSLDRVLARMLAKAPAARYPSADALLRALDTEIAQLAGSEARESNPALHRSRRRINTSMAIAGVTAVAILTFLALKLDDISGWFFAPPIDAASYAVLPLHWETPGPEAERHDALLHAGFARWPDLNVTQPLRIAEAVAREGGAVDLTPEDALRVARRLGAGRYVHGRGIVLGDSLQLDIVLHDALRDGATRRRVNLRVSRGDARAIALLVDSLLFGRVTWDGESRPDIGTSSSAARRFYGAAHEALREWDLARADSLFGVTTELDAGFSRAHLWLAQTRNWAGDQPIRWRSAAERASQEPAQLTERERLLAEGLALLGSERFAEACVRYRALVQADSRDFAGLFGLGECHMRDHIVVPDPGSPSRWAFRSSPHAGVESYASAYRALPANFTGIDGSASDALLRVLYTHPNVLRVGRSEGGRIFVAGPELRADTLALVPYPQDQFHWPSPQGSDRAVLRHRHLYHQIARTWAAAFPDDADALYALALSQEMLGDGAALETILRARTLATDQAQQLRLGVREVWIRVKAGTPERLSELARARDLADSLLVWPPGTSRQLDRELGGLALLIGRPAIAARYAPADGDGGAWNVSARAVAALLVFAAAGGPVDSIIHHERSVEHAIRSSIPRTDQPAARAGLMEQAAFLAFPVHRLSLSRSGEGLISPVARAQSLYHNGDSSRALAVLLAGRESTGGGHTLDVLYAEAALLAMLGDTARAIAWLDGTLTSLEAVPPGKLEDVARTGGLVRAMALRAELAAALGDRETAVRWARAVATLWSRGGEGTRPTFERMRTLQQGP